MAGPIEQTLQKEFDKEPEISFEDYGKQIGLSFPEDPQVLKFTEEELQQLPPAAPGAPSVDNPQGMTDKNKPESTAQKLTGDVASSVVGAGKGLVDLAQQGLNAILAVGDGIENTAAAYGFGSGDLIEKSDYINWSEKLPTSPDNVPEKVMRTITKYAAPVGGLAKLGVTGVRGLALNAGIDFSLLDPNQERLSNIILNEAPELKNVVVLGNALDALQYKTGETQFEGRFKNMVEGLIVAGGITSAAKGVASMFSGAIKVSNTAKRIIEQRKNASSAAAAATESVATPAAAQAGATVAAEGATISPQQLSFFDSEPIKQMADGQSVVNPMAPEIQDLLAKYVKENPAEDILHTSKNSEQLYAEVKDFIQDPQKMENLFSWTKAERPLQPVETKVLQFMALNKATMLDDLLTRTAQGATTLDEKAQLLSMLDSYNYLNTLRKGTGSAAGAALQAQKLSAGMDGMKLSEMRKLMDAKQADEFLKDFVKLSGGEDSVERLSKAYKALKESGMSAAQAMMKYEAGGNFRKAADTLQFVAINGMLSSPKTMIGNMAANIINSVDNVATNLTSSVIGKMLGHEDRVLAQEGVDYLRGAMASTMEGIAAAGNALKGKANPGPADILKVEFQRFNPISMNVAPEANLSTKVLGTIVNGTGMTVGLPTRVNATADAFMGTLNYRGELTRIAAQKARQAGLQGEDHAKFVREFLADPSVEAHKQAELFAQQVTFSQDQAANGMLGKASQALQGAINKVPLLPAVIPFVNTTTNITKFAIEHSPVGVLNFVTPATRSVIKRGGRDADIAMAKIANGMLFTGVATYLASEGLVTGPEPENYKVTQALQNGRTGWQATSIRIGDTYHKVERLDPFSSFLKLGAVMSQMPAFIDQEEYGQLAVHVGAAIADYYTPELLTNTMGDLFQAVNESRKVGNGTAVANFMSDTAARFQPFSALSRDIRNYDNELKSNTRVSSDGKNPIEVMIDKIVTRYKSQLPYFNRDLPVQRNMFGEPVYVPTAAYQVDLFAPFQSMDANESKLEQQLKVLAQYNEANAPIDKDLNALGLKLPPRNLRFEGNIAVEMTPQEYEKFQMLAGGLNPETGKPLGISLRQKLEPLVDGVFRVATGGNLTKNQYNNIVGLISEEVSSYTKRAQDMMKNDPEIRKRYMDRVKVMNEQAKVTSQILGY